MKWKAINSYENREIGPLPRVLQVTKEKTFHVTFYIPKGRYEEFLFEFGTSSLLQIDHDEYVSLLLKYC